VSWIKAKTNGGESLWVIKLKTQGFSCKDIALFEGAAAPMESPAKIRAPFPTG